MLLFNRFKRLSALKYSIFQSPPKCRNRKQTLATWLTSYILPPQQVVAPTMFEESLRATHTLSTLVAVCSSYLFPSNCIIPSNTPKRFSPRWWSSAPAPLWSKSWWNPVSRVQRRCRSQYWTSYVFLARWKKNYQPTHWLTMTNGKMHSPPWY